MTSDDSPFHAAERAIQERLGVREAMRRREGGLRARLTEQQTAFFDGLSYLPIATLDQAMRPVGSILWGAPGLVRSLDDQTLEISAPPGGGDPALAHVRVGAPIGAVGIDFTTRRRNRFSGVVSAVRADGFEVAVALAYGNCPQYIQARSVASAPEGDGPREPSGDAVRGVEFSGIDAAAAELIARADCFFVASRGPIDVEGGAARHGVDMSHRGGKPGFVRVEGDVLTIPDFPGNYFFNTFGNFAVNPSCALVFWDPDTGEMLHLRGEAEVEWEGAEASEFRGALRLWRVRATGGTRRPGAAPGGWRFVGASPSLASTGDWEEAAARRESADAAKAYRPFEVARIVDEAEGIKSFHLRPLDGVLPTHAAGQFLPVRVGAAPGGEALERCYTLSCAPSDGFFRITVKRQGRVSAHLHERVAVGHVIEARAPAGGLTLREPLDGSVALISAGVGITPMIAMARHLIGDGLRPRFRTPVLFAHAARSAAERPFLEEIRTMVASSEGFLEVHLFNSGGGPVDALQRSGRLTAEALSGFGMGAETHCYLCGPAGFMQAAYDALTEAGVPDGRIYAEAFGPSRLRRRVERDVRAADGPARARVRFARSDVEVDWRPGDGTLLEVAQAAGLSPDWSCGQGACGICAAGLVSGEVTYEAAPAAEVGAGRALICCARPRLGEEGGEPLQVVLDL